MSRTIYVCDANIVIRLLRDAIQARFALDKGYSVMSFDKDFKKWPDLNWSRPS